MTELINVSKTDVKTLSFKSNEKYNMGAVTYIVTAHFYDERETLKSKIFTLLTEDIKKST